MTTEDARKLFVAGLPDSISEEVLRQLFQATGSTVVEVSLPRDRTTGRTRGFGFVTLETVEQAERSRSALDGSVQAGRAISVRPFQGGTARRDSRTEGPSQGGVQAAGPAEDRTLYIGNLPYDASAAEVEELLTRCGVSPVLRVHLPIGPDGRPRGFGFVTLSSADAVLQSLNALSNADLRGRRVMVKVAHPRGAPGAGGVARSGGAPMRAVRPPQGELGAPSRFDGGRAEEAAVDSSHHRQAQASTDFEEDEEGTPAAAAKRTDKKRKGGLTAAAKRKSGADDGRRRGGASSWQRWEDWDED